MKEENKIVFLHVPKTGGGFLEKFYFNESRTIRRNFFLSFNGIDDSRFYSDEKATQHYNGNKCVVETAFENTEIMKRFYNSEHFKESKLLMGHTTTAIEEIFPEYNFKYFAIIREPIIRTLSNILQFTNYNHSEETCKFGAYTSRHFPNTIRYWEWIYDILSNELPLKGFMIHENHYLRNCQTKIIQGTKYISSGETSNIWLAKDKIDRGEVKISLFENFNEGLQKNFDKLDLPFSLENNTIGDGVPKSQINKQEKFGKYYGASEKIVGLIKEMNADDIDLYCYVKDNQQRLL